MIGRRTRMATVLWIGAMPGGQALAQDGANAPSDNPRSAVYQQLGAGLALRYEAAACGVVATAAQRDAIAQKLDALIRTSKSSASEVTAFKARVKTKIDPLIAANANFCTTIAQSYASYVDSFVAERPTAEWEDAAQAATGASSTLVSGWTIDTRDCTMTYAYGNEAHPTGIFLGKVPGAIAVTLQHDGWRWEADTVVPATTRLDQTAVTPIVEWHATKNGPYLAAVFAAAALPDFARTGTIALTFDGTQATPATFQTPGIADALVALNGCGQ